MGLRLRSENCMLGRLAGRPGSQQGPGVLLRAARGFDSSAQLRASWWVPLGRLLQGMPPLKRAPSGSPAAGVFGLPTTGRVWRAYDSD
jgi:hypothetical protein